MLTWARAVLNHHLCTAGKWGTNGAVRGHRALLQAQGPLCHCQLLPGAIPEPRDGGAACSWQGVPGEGGGSAWGDPSLGLHKHKQAGDEAQPGWDGLGAKPGMGLGWRGVRLAQGGLG